MYVEFKLERFMTKNILYV